VAYVTTSQSQGYELDASTASDFTGTLISSITPSAALGTLTTPATLTVNTTYYLRVGALASGTTYYGSSLSTSTLTNLVRQCTTLPGHQHQRDGKLDLSRGQWRIGRLPAAGFDRLRLHRDVALIFDDQRQPKHADDQRVGRRDHLLLAVGGLNWNNTPNYVVIPGSTVTPNLFPPPGGPTIGPVYITSITANWATVAERQRL